MNTHEAFSAFPEIRARQQWMYSLARPDVGDLLPFAAWLQAASCQIIRPPKTGVAMARGRMDATSARVDFFTLLRGEDDVA